MGFLAGCYPGLALATAVPGGSKPRVASSPGSPIFSTHAREEGEPGI